MLAEKIGAWYSGRAKNKMTQIQTCLERLSGGNSLVEPEKTFLQMKKLCEFFGHPEKCCPVFHVAGSKGKGSTAAYIASILDQAGYKVGRLASPYVAHFCERFQCGNEDFADFEYEQALDELEGGLKSLKITSLPHAVLMTLYGFLLFRKAGCDFMVIEVGMGGRLDPTNVVTPEVSVITTIEIEHQKILGDTLAKIAGEKAGIIKPGVPVVVTKQKPEAQRKILAVARERGAPVTTVNTHDFEVQSRYFFADSYDEFTGRPILRVEVSNVDFPNGLKLDLKMLGDFQVENSLLAATVVKVFERANKNFHLTDATIECGISEVALPARFDVRRDIIGYDGIPYLVIDGAHTPNSVAGAVRTFKILRKLESVKNAQDSCLTDFVPGAEPLLLFSTGEDKQVEKMAKELKKTFSVVIFTTLEHKKTSPKGIDKALTGAGFKTAFIKEPREAVKEALKIASAEKRPLVVVGSLYLAGEVYLELEEKAERFGKIIWN